MKKKGIKLLLVLPVLAALFLVPALTVLSFLPGSPLKPTGGYSLYENRSLAGPPVLTAESFWSGGYFAGWEDCLSDRFYGRDGWLKAHTALQLLRRSASVNDVVVADGALLPQNPIPNYESRDYASEAAQMADALSAIDRQVRSYGGVMLYAAVPEQRTALRGRYPAWQETNAAHLDRSADAFFRALEERDVPYLLLEPENPTVSYAATDHHYHLPGAYALYRAICQNLQDRGVSLPVVTEEHIQFFQLPNPFWGTYSRKLYGLSPMEEKLWSFTSDMAVPFQRTDNGQPVESTVTTPLTSDQEAVYYNYYMGGDQAETILDTGREDLPKVLVWGDSFTNALESILWMSFGEMRSLDLRYYDEMSLSDYIEAYRPDVVLCVRDDLNYLNPQGNGNIH